MDNLGKLYNNMVKSNCDSTIFAVNYNNHGFSCIFLIRDYGCTLFLTTLGQNPETIAVDIAPPDFLSPSRLSKDNYFILANYLGFTGRSGNIFYPFNFFTEFDCNINSKSICPATITEITRAIGRTADTAEEDKLYFCGWRRNGVSGHVTYNNFLKTKRLCGEIEANMIYNANISSRWTSIIDEENLSRINEYLTLVNASS